MRIKKTACMSMLSVSVGALLMADVIRSVKTVRGELLELHLVRPALRKELLNRPALVVVDTFELRQGNRMIQPVEEILLGL